MQELIFLPLNQLETLIPVINSQIMNYQEKVLSHLRESLFSALTDEEISPEQIFDVIREESASLIEYHKEHLARCQEFYEYFTNLSENFDSNGPSRWILPVEVDEISGDYFLTLPDEVMSTLGWDIGDELEFSDNGDGSFFIKKAPVKLDSYIDYIDL